MLSSVDAVERMRLSEKVMPTMEKRRSTVADDAGQPKYCRAIRARLGKRFLLSAHHLRPTHSPVSVGDLRQLEVLADLVLVRRVVLGRRRGRPSPKKLSCC